MREQVNRKKGATPAYAQLANIIKNGIATGKLKPGERIPSESNLAKEFGVSPMTARQAVNVLVEEELVNRIHGSGTFVKKIDVGATSFGLDVLDHILFDTKNLKVRILQSSIVKVSSEIRQALCLDESTPVICASRLIIHKDKPFSIQTSYLPFDPNEPVIENMLETTGLCGFFHAENHAGYKKGVINLFPWHLNPTEMAMLALSEDRGAFKLEYTYYDFTDRPSNYGWFIIPQDQLPLSSKVGVWNDHEVEAQTSSL